MERPSLGPQSPDTDTCDALGLSALAMPKPVRSFGLFPWLQNGICFNSVCLLMASGLKSPGMRYRKNTVMEMDTSEAARDAPLPA